MTLRRISISLGKSAMPVVADALQHARDNPEHDPIAFFELVDGTPKNWWVCSGPPPRTEDPHKLCAHGGDFP